MTDEERQTALVLLTSTLSNADENYVEEQVEPSDGLGFAETVDPVIAADVDMAAGDEIYTNGTEHDDTQETSSAESVPSAVAADTAPSSPTVLSGFPAAPFVHGEFRVALPELQIGNGDGRRNYNFESGPGRSLVHAALSPDSLAPIFVMQVDGVWHVVDGWARVTALRQQFGDSANIMVRAVRWAATAKDALYARFAGQFLQLGSRKIDKATLLLGFHRAWEVPQQILAARIGWTESKVSKQLAAAVLIDDASEFAQLLIKADDPPIDYLWKVQRAREDAAKDDAAHPKRATHNGEVAKLAAKLHELLAKPQRYDPNDALIRLGLVKSASAAGLSPGGDDSVSLFVTEPLEPFDCVEGSDGEPIAFLEMGADSLVNIRFVIDTASLTDAQKADARARLRDAIDRFIG